MMDGKIKKSHTFSKEATQHIWTYLKFSWILNLFFLAKRTILSKNFDNSVICVISCDSERDKVVQEQAEVLRKQQEQALACRLKASVYLKQTLQRWDMYMHILYNLYKVNFLLSY